jgi:phage-related minor tail protein
MAVWQEGSPGKAVRAALVIQEEGLVVAAVAAVAVAAVAAVAVAAVAGKVDSNRLDPTA